MTTTLVDAIRAALTWFDMPQPDNALCPPWVDFTDTTIAGFRIRLQPVNPNSGLPAMSFRTASTCTRQPTDGYRITGGGYGPTTMADILVAAEAAGVRVNHRWGGVIGWDFGWIEHDTHAHPTLAAAAHRYLADCPHHHRTDCRQRHGCDYYPTGIAALIRPGLPVAA